MFKSKNQTAEELADKEKADAIAAEKAAKEEVKAASNSGDDSKDQEVAPAMEATKKQPKLKEGFSRIKGIKNDKKCLVINRIYTVTDEIAQQLIDKGFAEKA